jgi:hypothetical protein
MVKKQFLRLVVLSPTTPTTTYPAAAPAVAESGARHDGGGAEDAGRVSVGQREAVHVQVRRLGGRSGPWVPTYRGCGTIASGLFMISFTPFMHWSWVGMYDTAVWPVMTTRKLFFSNALIWVTSSAVAP